MKVVGPLTNLISNTFRALSGDFVGRGEWEMENKHIKQTVDAIDKTLHRGTEERPSLAELVIRIDERTKRLDDQNNKWDGKTERRKEGCQCTQKTT